MGERPRCGAAVPTFAARPAAPNPLASMTLPPPRVLGPVAGLTAAVLCALAPRAGEAQTLDTLPGGIVRYDDYRAPDGFYVFWPALPADAEVYSRDSLGLTIFSHGHSVLNPVTYGAWLRHLVLEQRQVVVYPRYQRNWVMPGSRAFAKTHHAGLSAALAYLDTAGLALGHAPPIYIGHSYGAVLTAYALARQDSLGYPPAFGALLAAPGTYRLKGSRLGDYSSIPAATQVLVVSHEDDAIVGDEFAELLFETAPAGARTAWLQQSAQAHGDRRLGAGHSECYGVDEVFDTGRFRLKAEHTRRISCVDALDRELYWALADELIAARREGRPHAVFRNQTDEHAFGYWPDGSPREPLRIRHRSRAAPLPFLLAHSRDGLLDLLSESNGRRGTRPEVQIPYSLDEALDRLSDPTTAPAEAAAPAPRR